MIIDTCEAMSLFDAITAPNLILMGTSIHGKSAYSHQFMPSINLFLNDHFSYDFYDDLERGKITEKTKVRDLKTLYPNSRINSDVDFKSTLTNRDLKDVYLYEYIPVGKYRAGGPKHF